jgi:hypothetical protein
MVRRYDGVVLRTSRISPITARKTTDGMQ